LTIGLARRGDEAVDTTNLKEGFSIGKIKRCRNGQAMTFRIASEVELQDDADEDDDIEDTEIEQ